LATPPLLFTQTCRVLLSARKLCLLSKVQPAGGAETLLRCWLAAAWADSMIHRRHMLTVHGVVGGLAGFLVFAGNVVGVRRDQIETVFSAGVDAVAVVIEAQAERIE